MAYTFLRTRLRTRLCTRLCTRLRAHLFFFQTQTQACYFNYLIRAI